MTRVPNPKGNALIERLNSFSESDRKNQFAMEGLRREARSIRSADPSMSFQLEGLIEFAAGQSNEGMALFEKAIRLDPNRYVFRSNYALSLFSIGDYSRAYDQQEHACRLTEGSPDDAKDLCKLALFAGRFSRSKQVLELLDRMKAEVAADVRSTILTTASIQAARGFSDEESAQFFAGVYSFFLDRNIENLNIVLDAFPVDELGLITVDVSTNRSSDEVVTIEAELLEYRIRLGESQRLACAVSVNLRTGQ